MCAARFDIRYTFTIAQAIDTSLHRYRCLVQSEFFVSTGSAHALVHTLASRWTPSRLTLVRSPLSVLLARPAGITGDGGRTRRRTRRDFFRFSFSCFSSSFFILSFVLYFCHLCARVCIIREKKRSSTAVGRHEGGGIYFCHEILHFELSVSETAREPCTHTRRACRLASCSSVIRIRMAYSWKICVVILSIRTE